MSAIVFLSCTPLRCCLRWKAQSPGVITPYLQHSASPESSRMAEAGAIKSVGQITAPLCPAGASENSPAFQRRVSGPKARSAPKGQLKARSILSRPFGTRVSLLASPALKRRAIARCPSGTKLPRPMPDALHRTRQRHDYTLGWHGLGCMFSAARIGAAQARESRLR